MERRDDGSRREMEDAHSFIDNVNLSKLMKPLVSRKTAITISVYGEGLSP